MKLPSFIQNKMTFLKSNIIYIKIIGKLSKFNQYNFIVNDHKTVLFNPIL